MDAKDFLKMNEQMIAFNTLMKGDLAKEVQAAKDAIDQLGGAKAIKGLQDQLDKDKVEFEDYKMSIESFLETSKEALAVQTYEINQERIKLAADQTDVIQASHDLEQAKGEFEGIQAEAQAALAAARQELADKSSLVEADRIALDKGFADIAARELVVSQKLAAMKAIV